MIFKFFEHQWFAKYQDKCNSKILNNIQDGEIKLMKMTVTIGSLINTCYSDKDRISIFNSVEWQFSCDHQLTPLVVKDILSDMDKVK